MLKFCYFVFDGIVRHPLTFITGLIMLATMLVVLSGGCEVPQDGRCPDGRCPERQEGCD